MIMIATRDGHDHPEILCDRCGTKIDADKGWAYWRGADDGHKGSLVFYHDGCEHKQIFGADSSAMPLTDFLHYLCFNSNFSTKTNT